MKPLGNIIAIVGCQWGDEGKGKLVDILAKDFDYIVRATGGANAGHTIYVNDKKFVFHQVPSGALYEHTHMVIANGVVVHIPSLVDELNELKREGIKLDGRLSISDRAHIVFDYHKAIDRALEEEKGSGKIGTTGRGIGPAYNDKISRVGIRIGELRDWESFVERFKANCGMHHKRYPSIEIDAEKELEVIKAHRDEIMPFITDTAVLLNAGASANKKLLLEGANGAMLDIDHGTYPFVTSSNATIGGIVTGTGIAPNKITSVIGIVKAYMTRVGSGPFPSELEDEIGARLREQGAEYGATTGRPRRCGWFDAVATRYTCMLNGVTHVNLTKLDVLTGIDPLKIVTSYKNARGETYDTVPADLASANYETVSEDIPGWNEPLGNARSFDALPETAQTYVNKLESLIGAPVTYIGTGYNRDQMVVKR